MMRQRTPARMGRLVAQWRQSGESQAGFARRRGIPTCTFWYWCRKLTEAAAPALATPTFVPVQVAAEPAGIEITLSSGERLQP